MPRNRVRIGIEKTFMRPSAVGQPAEPEPVHLAVGQQRQRVEDHAAARGAQDARVLDGDPVAGLRRG